MRYPRLVLIVMAAMLCIAASVVAHDGIGMKHGTLVMGQTEAIGQVNVHNTGRYEIEGVDHGSKLEVSIIPEAPGWAVLAAQSWVSFDPVPVTRKGAAIPGQFNRQLDDGVPVPYVVFYYDLEDDFGFRWGQHHPHDLNVAVHADLVRVDEYGNMLVDDEGEPIVEGAWSYVEGATEFEQGWGWHYVFRPYKPQRGQLIDAPVKGAHYLTETHSGYTGDPYAGGFYFFPREPVSFFIGDPDTGGFYIGTATASKKVSLLDMKSGADVDDPWVIGAARAIQTLDSDDHDNGTIHIAPQIANCFAGVAANMGFTTEMFSEEALVTDLLQQTIFYCDQNNPEADLDLVDEPIGSAEAQDNLEKGISQSGIFRKNVSKTEDWGETKQKLDVMPVYFPGKRSNGDPSFCDLNDNAVFDEGEEGVPYEEWRLNGDPAGEECNPRVDGEACVVTLIECREVAKPIIVTYMEKIDIHDQQVTTDFWDGRFAYDIVTAISRDDGATFKRKNISRMADKSSFELETGEPFHGTTRGPVQKINDNKILVVWTSTFCKSGTPRYAITTCDDPETEAVETPDTGCQMVCPGGEDGGPECRPDYPGDDAYFITDIWGVRGQQRSVNYDEVDDVAELGIGEIPYSCLWAARGAIVTQADIVNGTYASINVDDPETPDVVEELEVGEIIWYKPERLTSGRRDAFFPVVGSARGAGFAIAWQEDPEGLRPGKGKGPGQGWSGAITNHKTDIWYSFIRYDDFGVVDPEFPAGGPPEDGGPESTPGFGRPKALVPFSLPVRITDNDMVNTDTLKVELDGNGLPVVIDGSFNPVDPLTVEHGNATGTKRYAYLARSIDEYGYDEYGNYVYMPEGDGTPDYQYYVDTNDGILDLCDTSEDNTVMTALPGGEHQRWYRFTNTDGAEKTVCVSSDGRLLDGDVFAARPNIQLQPYTKPDETKSAWVLLAYEETKGMGHAHADETDGGGQTAKPLKQDFGKNVLYHSFDFTQPDLVAPGHQINLPALCGGLFSSGDFCEEDHPESYDAFCNCQDTSLGGLGAGAPVPLYFDYQDENGLWLLDTESFLQYRSEVARRVRFIMQSPSKMGDTNTLGAIIFKQGQEGQGRPADVFIRRFVKSGQGNPYRFENIECNAYLDQFFSGLPECPNGPGDKDSASGYNCNVWGEAAGDRLCGGVFTDSLGGYARRDHINLTSADIDFAVDAGPDDDTPDDPTDDVYGTNKVLLWSQHDYNLGNESYGYVGDLGESCDVLDLNTPGDASDNVCPGMYSNAKSHRGFIRGDFLVTAYAATPNWAAARNGRDRYNFYVRRSFDGGQTWTSAPAGDPYDGEGVSYCPEYRTDPDTHEAPDVFLSDGITPIDECVDWCPDPVDMPCPEGEVCPTCTVNGTEIGPGDFQPAIQVSEFDNNKETSSDPRVGATPPQPPLDGRVASLPNMCQQGICYFVEDNYENNIFFVAWGGGDNVKSIGGTTETPEAPPTDIWYTRSADYGDTFLKEWFQIGGANSQQGVDTWVTRYDFLAKGDEEEQGECQLRATPDGSKMYAIWHQLVPPPGDPDEPLIRWNPWEPEESSLNDIWFRRVIFWSDEGTTP